MDTVGERFAKAVAERDAEGLSSLLAPDVDFRAMTPSKFWRASSPDEVVGVVLGHWFEEKDRIEAVTRLEGGDDVGDTHHVAYRFDLANENGAQVIEQQAYYRDDGDRLTYLRIVCSGFRPRS